jgi:uncharacterized protein YdeI (YjbR/CyaY-like superfamily)
VSESAESTVVAFDSIEAWHDWLSRRDMTSDGVWLKIAKKDSGIATVSYSEALDVALCHGWIDGQKKKFDDEYWLQRFTPRRPRSKWSKINCDKATELIEQGRMEAAGLAEVERAKADGRWDAAYDSPSTATIPDDLQRELDKNKAARESFEALSKSSRYSVIYRVQDAKRPETRARRIAQFVEMLAEGRTIHP